MKKENWSYVSCQVMALVTLMTMSLPQMIFGKQVLTFADMVLLIWNLMRRHPRTLMFHVKDEIS